MLSSENPLLEKRFELLLKAANLTLLLSAPLLMATIVTCYPMSHHFSLPEQVAGHIFILISATLIKIGYVTAASHNIAFPLKLNEHNYQQFLAGIRFLMPIFGLSARNFPLDVLYRSKSC